MFQRKLKIVKEVLNDQVSHRNHLLTYLFNFKISWYYGLVLALVSKQIRDIFSY